MVSCPESCPGPMPSKVSSSPGPDPPACSSEIPSPGISSTSSTYSNSVSNSVSSSPNTSSTSSSISSASANSAVSVSTISSISTSSTSSKISSSSPSSIYATSSSSSPISSTSSTSSSGASSRTSTVSIIEPGLSSSPLPAVSWPTPSPPFLSPSSDAPLDNSGEPRPTFSDNPLIRSFKRFIFFKPPFFSVSSTAIEPDTVSFASLRISIIWSNPSVPPGCKLCPNLLRILSFASSDITKVLLDPIFIPSGFFPFS